MPRFPQEIAGLMKGLLKGIMVVTQPSMRPDFPGGDVCERGMKNIRSQRENLPQNR